MHRAIKKVRHINIPIMDRIIWDVFFFRYRHSPEVQILLLHYISPSNSLDMYHSILSCPQLHTQTNSLSLSLYNLDSLYAFNFFTISSCAAFLRLAYFRNNDFWSPSHNLTALLFDDPSSCASIITRIGYLLTHFGVMVLVGKTCWTQDIAVSRSCAPPSQLRDLLF